MPAGRRLRVVRFACGAAEACRPCTPLHQRCFTVRSTPWLLQGGGPYCRRIPRHLPAHQAAGERQRAGPAGRRVRRAGPARGAGGVVGGGGGQPVARGSYWGQGPDRAVALLWPPTRPTRIGDSGQTGLWPLPWPPTHALPCVQRLPAWRSATAGAPSSAACLLAIFSIWAAPPPPACTTRRVLRALLRLLGPLPVLLSTPAEPGGGGIFVPCRGLTKPPAAAALLAGGRVVPRHARQAAAAPLGHRPPGCAAGSAVQVRGLTGFALLPG